MRTRQFLRKLLCLGGAALLLLCLCAGCAALLAAAPSGPDGSTVQQDKETETEPEPEPRPEPERSDGIITTFLPPDPAVPDTALRQ